LGSKGQSSRSRYRGGGAQHSTLPSSATFSSFVFRVTGKMRPIGRSLKNNSLAVHWITSKPTDYRLFLFIFPVVPCVKEYQSEYQDSVLHVLLIWYSEDPFKMCFCVCVCVCVSALSFINRLCSAGARSSRPMSTTSAVYRSLVPATGYMLQLSPYHNCDSTTIRLRQKIMLTCSFFARVEWNQACEIRRSRIVVVS